MRKKARKKVSLDGPTAKSCAPQQDSQKYKMAKKWNLKNEAWYSIYMKYPDRFIDILIQCKLYIRVLNKHCTTYIKIDPGS